MESPRDPKIRPEIEGENTEEELRKLKAKLNESKIREKELKDSPMIKNDSRDQSSERNRQPDVDPNIVVEWSGRERGDPRKPDPKKKDTQRSKNHDINFESQDPDEDAPLRKNKTKSSKYDIEPVDASNSRLVKKPKKPDSEVFDEEYEPKPSKKKPSKKRDKEIFDDEEEEIPVKPKKENKRTDSSIEFEKEEKRKLKEMAKNQKRTDSSIEYEEAVRKKEERDKKKRDKEMAEAKELKKQEAERLKLIEEMNEKEKELKKKQNKKKREETPPEEIDTSEEIKRIKRRKLLEKLKKEEEEEEDSPPKKSTRRSRDEEEEPEGKKSTRRSKDDYSEDVPKESQRSQRNEKREYPKIAVSENFEDHREVEYSRYRPIDNEEAQQREDRYNILNSNVIRKSKEESKNPYTGQSNVPDRSSKEPRMKDSKENFETFNKFNEEADNSHREPPLSRFQNENNEVTTKNIFAVEDSESMKNSNNREVRIEETYYINSKDDPQYSMKPIEGSEMERSNIRRTTVIEKAEYKKALGEKKFVEERAKSVMPIEAMNEEEYVEQFRIQKAEETNEDKDSFIIIPLLTFPKIKSFKKKTADVKADENKPILDQLTDKDDVEDLLNLSGTIIEDLKSYNKNNEFVRKLEEDHEYLRKNIKEMDKKDREEFMEKFREYLDNLNKLDVTHKPFIQPAEEKIFQDLDKREVINQLLKSQIISGPNDQMTSFEEVTKKSKDIKKVKESIMRFLHDYKARIARLNTPSSETLAREVEESILKIDIIETLRPDLEGMETLKLVGHSISKNFGAGGKEVPIIDDNSIKEEPKVLAFNDFLRAMNKLSELKFTELDDMITDNFNRRNILDLRHSLLSSNQYDSNREKLNDIIKINSLTDDKPRIENLLVLLGRELLPPRAYTNNPKMTDSDVSLNIVFMDLKKKPVMKEDKKSPSDPNPIVISTKEQIGLKDSGKDNSYSPEFANKFSHIEPNVVDSDEDIPYIVDIHEEWIEKLEMLIDRVREEKDNLNEIKEDVKDKSKEKDLKDEEKIPMLIQLSQALESYSELEAAAREFKTPYIETLEKQNNPGGSKAYSSKDDSKKKGILKLYPKFVQELAKLKYANQSIIKELNQSKHMKIENNVEREKEIDQLNKELIGAHKALESMEIGKVEDAAYRSGDPKKEQANAKEFENKIERIAKFIRQYKEKGEKQDSKRNSPVQNKNTMRYDDSVSNAGEEQNARTSKIQKNLLKATKSLLKSLEEAKGLSEGKGESMSPLELKNEMEQKQTDYETSRNNFRTEIGKNLTKLMLAQKDGLLPAANGIIDSFDQIFDIIEENKDRKVLTDKVLDFYVKLRGVKFSEADVERIELQHKIEMQDMILEEKITPVSESDRPSDQPKVEPMTLEELKQAVKDGLVLIQKKSDALEDPLEKKAVENKIQEITQIIDSNTIPPVECMTEVKELLIRLNDKQNSKMESIDTKTPTGRRQSVLLDEMKFSLGDLNLKTDFL